MNKRLVLNIIGKVLLIEGFAMIPPLFIALVSREGDGLGLLISFAITLTVGFLLSKIRYNKEVLRAREGFASVALCWFALSFFGSLPFTIGGYTSFVDGIFECVSGFTTTGSTLLTNVEALPKGILFWRSLTHWIGGMGVLVLSVALIPKMGAQAVHLLRAESTGPNPGKLVPKLGETTRILYLIYIGLSGIMTVILMALGMSPYDALIHMFGSAGTGGFSNYNASVGHFNNPAIDNVISTFVLLFGINFSLYFLLLQRNIKDILKNEELRAYVLITLASVALVAVSILPIYGSVWEALRYSYFQVSSIITSTGYATADFNLWPMASKSILVALMLFGCCAGSTGGGIKIIRGLIMAKGIMREVKKTINPRSVAALKIQGRVVEEKMVMQVMMFFFTYILLVVVGTLLISIDNFSFETSLTAVITCISNIGPGLGDVGPTGNFSAFSPFSKLVLSLLMLIGRLEIFPVLMLMSPGVWKRS